MGSFFKPPKVPKGPGPAELRRREEAARQAERDRLAREEAQRKETAEQEKLKSFAAQESRRKAFAGQLAAEAEGTGDQRRRYLKGA